MDSNARVRAASWLLGNRVALAFVAGGAIIVLTGAAMRIGLLASTRDVAPAEAHSLAGSLDFARVSGVARADAALRAGTGDEQTIYTPLVAAAGETEVHVLLSPEAVPAGEGRFVGVVSREVPSSAGPVLARIGLALAPAAVVLDTHLTPEERRSAGWPVAGGGLVALLIGIGLFLRRRG